jgi:hypothetical protein
VFFLGGVPMLSLLIPRPRRPILLHLAVVWVCACSLIVVLANRVPRIPGNETGWVTSAPSQMTAKVVAKDFFMLHPPAARSLLLPRSLPVRMESHEEQLIVFVALDNHLLTRPPPCT